MDPLDSSRTIGTLLPFNPEVVLTDFELAIQNAYRHCFPHIVIKGCYFHFKHAHQSWLCTHGWKKLYKSNSEFRIWINMFGALALMSLDRIPECMLIIKSKAILLTGIL